MSCTKTVGIWFSTKKKKKLNVEKLKLLFKERGYAVKEIDTSLPLAEQGPFVAIVHKLTDLMILAETCNKAALTMRDIQDYIGRHPSIVMVDPLPNIRVILNRYETYSMLKQSNIFQHGLLHVPDFAQITTRDKQTSLAEMKEMNVQFPIVCKKNVAHGTASHQVSFHHMCIIFNEEGLKDVDPPCVVQTFVDHGALLYKIYVIADKHHIVQRPSLKNFAQKKYRDHETIHFDSHDISSGGASRSKLTTLSADDVGPSPLNTQLISKLTSRLSDEIELTMYGIDVIVCTSTLKHYIIDVNVFPGYDGVHDYLDTLSDHVVGRIQQQVGRIQQQNGLHDDSGEGRMDDTTTTNGVHNGSGETESGE